MVTTNFFMAEPSSVRGRITGILRLSVGSDAPKTWKYNPIAIIGLPGHFHRRIGLSAHRHIGRNSSHPGLKGWHGWRVKRAARIFDWLRAPILHGPWWRMAKV